jgi:dihydroflavonol-4-reductase
MILVTGGTGLVGAHLLLRLAENEVPIRALYRNEVALKKTKALFSAHNKSSLFTQIEWVLGDILDVPSLESAFQNIKLVYHCAGLISFDPKDEERLRKTNIEGTANIVNFCIAYQIQKLGYVSSIAALGDLAQNETTISESSEWNPEFYHSDYGISKYGAELEVWRGYQEGLPVVIVNPGVIIGSTLWEDGSGAIISKVKKGMSFYTKGQTGYVGVDDVVAILIALLNSPISGERYSLVAEHYTYEALLKTIALKTGSAVPSVYIKPWITSIAWRLDWILATFFFKKRTLTKYMATTIHTIDCYSNAKVKRDLNYEFQSIPSVLDQLI